MCENLKCVYPFTQSDITDLLIEGPDTYKGYSIKKRIIPSTAANTAGVPAASVVHSEQSATDPRQGLIATKPSDSLLKQKEQMQLKALPIAKEATHTRVLHDTQNIQEHSSIVSRPIVTPNSAHNNVTTSKDIGSSTAQLNVTSLVKPVVHPQLVPTTTKTLAGASNTVSSDKTSPTAALKTIPTTPVLASAKTSIFMPRAKSNASKASTSLYIPKTKPKVATSTTPSIYMPKAKPRADLNNTFSTGLVLPQIPTRSPTTSTSSQTSPKSVPELCLDMNFDINDIEGLLTSDMGSISSAAPTPEGVPDMVKTALQQTEWLNDLQDIFTAPGVIESTYNPLS
ncbi:hypothetical protein G6F70_005230 [Rhizopus microsporus]|nr:hypothetical protein G6F71_004147 [Rhizopus microsporus]KAG1199096.1 hypothetical protein G6F70_005230 [Rhizopus microsporus]KAG1211672.1 hypothetical protein G6F69_004390 [Rhizopus microsporus]KAG1232719.1 hypothetical protein G6F67_004808 [Rhizopus microsporus]KAG1266057.1 hypothetical protein G6F68_003066 [Rhizopus microsporus]